MKTILIAMLVLLAPFAQPASATAARDGQHDFDWEAGAWNTKVKRLREPLSGKQDWLEYAGTSVITPLVGARANIVELDVNGSAGRIAGVSLRLYSPPAGSGHCTSPTWPTD